MGLRAATLLMPGCAVASSEPREPRTSPAQQAVFERSVDLSCRRGHVRAAFDSCLDVFRNAGDRIVEHWEVVA